MLNGHEVLNFHNSGSNLPFYTPHCAPVSKNILSWKHWPKGDLKHHVFEPRLKLHDEDYQLPSFQNKIASSCPLLPKIAQPFLHYCQISLLNIVRTTYKQLHHIKAINFDIPRDSNNIVFLWLLHTVCSNPLIVINAWRKWHQFLELRHFSYKTVWIAFLHVWFILFYFWFNNFLLSLPIGKQKITGWRWAIYPKIWKTVVMLLFQNCLNRMKCYRLCSSRI